MAAAHRGWRAFPCGNSRFRAPLCGPPGLGEPFARERKRGVPAPAVDAGHAHALLEKKERGFATHAAAGVEKVRLTILGARRGVHEDDVEGLERIADAVKFAFDVVSLAHI